MFFKKTFLLKISTFLQTIQIIVEAAKVLQYMKFVHYLSTDDGWSLGPMNNNPQCSNACLVQGF
jgi:hypothetical protein